LQPIISTRRCRAFGHSLIRHSAIGHSPSAICYLPSAICDLPKPMLLALDTATRHSGIALYDGQHTLVELNWYSSNGQTTELLPRLHQLLDWQGLTPTALSAIGVSLGPGSFTGLRVALSLAKGMALAHSLDLVGVSTLDVIAFPYLACSDPVYAVIPAGRGRVCWTTYGSRPGDDCQATTIADWQGWRQRDRLTDSASLSAALTHRPGVVVGELPERARQQLAAAFKDPSRVKLAGITARRAAVLAHLGWANWKMGLVSDPASLSPIYLREP
jgi:tRNA threonylcarbamoyladenosine biosynthesis protein TsaB